jgi:hypothetical protein
MARRPDPKLHSLWRDRVRRQEASGLTIAQFCARQRIARSKFHSWKRRFRHMDSSDRCLALPAPPAFLPVTVSLDERTSNLGASGLPIEADLPNGIRLRIPTGNVRLACRLVRSIAGARTDSGGPR